MLFLDLESWLFRIVFSFSWILVLWVFLRDVELRLHLTWRRLSEVVGGGEADTVEAGAERIIVLFGSSAENSWTAIQPKYRRLLFGLASSLEVVVVFRFVFGEYFT